MTPMPLNLHQTTLSKTSPADERPHAKHVGRSSIARFAALFGVVALIAATPPASAQDEEEFGGSGVDAPEEPDEPPVVTRTNPVPSGGPMPADFSGTLQIVRGPPGTAGARP